MRWIRRINHVCPDLKSFRMARSMFVPNYKLLPQFAVFCVLTAPLRWKRLRQFGRPSLTKSGQYQSIIRTHIFTFPLIYPSENISDFMSTTGRINLHVSRLNWPPVQWNSPRSCIQLSSCFECKGLSFMCI